MPSSGVARRVCAALVAVSTIVPGIAAAQEPAAAGQAQEADDADKYNFFSQPTASREQVLADFDECRELASGVKPPQPGYVYSQGIAGAAAVGLLQGFMKGAQRRHMFDAALRKCMSVKGYARYPMSKEQAKLVYDGSWTEMREKLADRAIASTEGMTRMEP